MAYTEKVSLNGTALSFLLYECVNSSSSQEGFLIGNVTTEITNHISDSQNDSARLDTQIFIRTVLPVPSVALFYFPTGKIKEEILSDLLSSTANDIVGWYKYRKNSSIKPTFRDKLISRGLQKYFEKYHGKKNFVTCNLSSKTSSSGSTHTFTYRFGKINCFNMYEYIEDVTANLGEKLTGYKKAPKVSPHSIFNKIVSESNVQNNNTNDAILHIQEAVDIKMISEAKLAAKNESAIRELEAEIKHMTGILSDKHMVDLQAAYNKLMEEKLINREVEMAEACVNVLKSPPSVDIMSIPNIFLNSNNLSDSENSVQLIENESNERSSSPIAVASTSTKPSLNYAAACKKSSDVKPSTSKTDEYEDLICFDVEDKHVAKPLFISDNIKCLDDSSPEF
ncbi:PREDICTED: BRCA1-A complex subunit Abraxas-like [Papilio xuthus]|uniref:BRCA1-A complex subunit Abraxas-like n=1 Tax=Papilio xuthus TaxID=66420 RepID=A0AAJ6ZY10_PAPXU|nr:PREDICTED: BRCA1-A complex subunit Abraxas-like [Papilio xuthus]